MITPRVRTLLCCLLVLSGARSISWAAESLFQDDLERPPTPLIIAHRGASGVLPEHTLAAYAAAHLMGADMIEPDVVLTRDGVPICAHDITLEETTDVADLFPGRARSDGHYYAIDFTLDEIRRLDKIGRDGRPRQRGHRIPTLREMAELVQDLNQRTGRTVGIIPEAKRPDFHRAEGRAIEPVLIRTLADLGYDDASDTCVIQCFDLDAIDRMRNKLGSKLPMVWLVGEAPDRASLDRARTLCDALGPRKSLLGVEHAGRWLPSAMYLTVREMGFDLYPWTFDDNARTLRAFRDDIPVSGVFTDFTDVAVKTYRGD